MSGEAIQKGVTEAFDFWLSQHDVTMPACIEYAVEKAMKAWLEEHTEEIIERIAAKSPTVECTNPEGCE